MGGGNREECYSSGEPGWGDTTAHKAAATGTIDLGRKKNNREERKLVGDKELDCPVCYFWSRGL